MMKKTKKINEAKLSDDLREMADLFSNYKSDITFHRNKVSKCDLAISDILHIIELTRVSVFKKIKAVNKLKKLTRERRYHKNIEAAMTSMNDAASKNKGIVPGDIYLKIIRTYLQREASIGVDYTFRELDINMNDINYKIGGK